MTRDRKRLGLTSERDAPGGQSSVDGVSQRGRRRAFSYFRLIFFQVKHCENSGLSFPTCSLFLCPCLFEAVFQRACIRFLCTAALIADCITQTCMLHFLFYVAERARWRVLTENTGLFQ